MRIVRVPTSAGIDDIKLIGENESERAFIKQLAEAGTLSSVSRSVADSVVFRPISVSAESTGSSYYSSDRKIGKYDFAVRQNENHAFDLTFNSQNTDPVTPIDLTVYTAIKLQVKSRKGAPALMELSLGAGLTVSGADNNVLSVAFTAAQTKLMTCESYYYDILMVKPSSNTYYLEGKITVKKSVTQ